MAIGREYLQRQTMQNLQQFGKGVGGYAAMSPEERMIQGVKMESPGGLATVKKYIETLLMKEKMPIQSLLYLASVDPALASAPKAKQYLSQTLGSMASPDLGGMTPKDRQATLESHAKIILDRIVGIEQRMAPTGEAKGQMMGALTAGLGRAVPGAELGPLPGTTPGAQAPGAVGLPTGYGEWKPETQKKFWPLMGAPGGMPGTRQQVAGAQLRGEKLPPVSAKYMEFAAAKNTYFADLPTDEKAIVALFTSGSKAALSEVGEDAKAFAELEEKWPELKVQAAQLKTLLGMEDWRSYDSSVIEGKSPEEKLEAWGWLVKTFGPHMSVKGILWVMYNWFFARPEEEIGVGARKPYEDIQRWGWRK